MEDEYLGDGLYASFDGWMFRLWTERENGVHEVFLEPSVVARFNAYAKHKMLEGVKS
jgi:hypothetical protein